ncbi:MAG: glycosyl hydrolase 53 family protein [Firmicutes bacterium]|nr:glycosyl hydrolase 53 family protein [Bacillota bacterium]
MKKIKTAFAIILCLSLFGIPTIYAEEVSGVSEKTGAWETTVTGLDAGYYDITAEFNNSTVMTESVLYAESAMSEKASSVIPKTATTNTNTNGYTEVSVRSVYTSDGSITIGVSTENTALYTNSLSVTAADGERVFLNGGDMSEYTYVSESGGKYYDFDGNAVNPIEFLAESGMDAARIRLSNNPGKEHGDGNYYLPDGYQDLADCISLAKQAQDAGMKIVFTFNYSDYWSNGERQIIPQDWADSIKADLGYDVKDFDFLAEMTSSQRTEIQSALATLIYDYTKKCMQALADEGIYCDYVSLGNEINGGMLFPFANTYKANMGTDFELNFGENITDEDLVCPKDLTALGTFLNAGYRAVKEVSPDSQVIIHFAGDDLDDNFNWIIGQSEFKKAGTSYDVIGISYYPAWSDKTASECASYVNTLGNLYNKDVMIMETGFKFNETTTYNESGQLSNIDAYKDIYPDSQEGHKGYMAEMINAMRNTDYCIGILYWDPLMIHVEDEHGNNLTGWAISEDGDSVQSNVVENTTLFDFNGKAIETVKLYNNTKSAVKKEAYILEDLTETSVTVTKNDTANAAVIIAVYDENGVLSGVALESGIPTGEETTVSYSLDELTGGKTAKTVKAFLWNLDNTAEPLCASEELTIE